MITQVDTLLEDFETHDPEKWDFEEYQKLKEITHHIIRSKSQEVVPYFIQFLKDNKHLTAKGYPDNRFLSILEILSFYKNPSCLPELFKIAENPMFSQHEEDIIHCLGQFKTQFTRDFFRKHLSNSRLYELCAIQLAYFPDPSGESILFQQFQKSLTQNNFSQVHFKALINIRNTRVWQIVENYLNKTPSERERYRIIESLVQVNDRRIIPILISCYEHYKLHNLINYSDVKSISLEGENLILTKAQKESIPFPKKMRKKILSILRSYHSDFRVKTFLKKIDY